jgi:hypothetical protein
MEADLPTFQVVAGFDTGLLDSEAATLDALLAASVSAQTCSLRNGFRGFFVFFVLLCLKSPNLRLSP